MIERVKCSVNLDALRNTHVCAQEHVLLMTVLKNELSMELRTYRIAMRTVFAAQMRRSLAVRTTESKWWHAYCTVTSSSILLVTSLSIPLDGSTPRTERCIFFYRVSTKDLVLTSFFPVTSNLPINQVSDVVCWQGDSNSLQDSTILLLGNEELSGNTACVMIESKRVHILGCATQMKVLCQSKHIALLSVQTTVTQSSANLLPSGVYLVRYPHYELIRITSDGHVNQEMTVLKGLLLRQGFLLLLRRQHGHLALTIHYLLAEAVPKLMMCAEARLTFSLRAPQVLVFDTYHSMFIIDSSPDGNLAKEARRVDLLSVLVCAMDEASTTQLRYIRTALSVLIKAVTEGFYEAQIDRAASVAVANRLMSHTNSTVDNFNLALARAQKLEEADVKQRQRILELEEERKGDDALLAQFAQKNQELEQCTANQLDMMHAYQDTISRLRNLQDAKKEQLINQMQSAMDHASSLTCKLQSLIEEISKWS
ncbi:Hypothetical protein GLP15_3852 [Giardia lamblia P15]|uniref:Uncharacterized protein n=1 Tax=Giardia intestinalis (strain P15) TaxID=658858 RepID=E1F1C0_GIAIA|nr:Hypothetical protein GLP15_3852 [Giardia lamblia P15]